MMIIIIEFRAIKIKFLIAVIYRHSNNSYKDFLEALDDNLQLLNQRGNNVLIMGDININVNANGISSKLQLITF